MVDEFRREYLLRLPLPLAQLYARAHNAKDPRSRHDNAFYLWEALVKLAAAPLVAWYLASSEQGTSPRVPALDRLLSQLALPSFGQWVAILRGLARHMAEQPLARAQPLAHLWAQLNTPRRDLPSILALYRRVKNGPDRPGAGDQSCSLLQLIDAMVQYRNAVFGHGAGRNDAFYEREMGPLLSPAANEILAEGVLDLLGPRGSRLVYLTEVRTMESDRVEVGLRDLVGLQGERIAPLSLSAAEAFGLAPNRVAILWPGRPAPVRIDPLLVYRESETAGEVLFLNRDRDGRQVEYLSYLTGRTERDRSTAAELAALLARVVQRPVSEPELEALAQQSVAETPSVEALWSDQAAPARRLGEYEILEEIGRGGMGVVYLARQLSLGRLVALKTLPTDLQADAVSLARFRREIRHLAQCDHPHIVKILSSGTLPDGQLYYTMEFVPGCDLDHVFRELTNTESAAPNTIRELENTVWTRCVRSAAEKQRLESQARSERTAAGRADQTSGGSSGMPSRPVATSVPRAVPLPAGDETRDYVRTIVELGRDAALALAAVHEQQVVHRDVKPGNLMLTADGARIVLMDFGLAKGALESQALSSHGGFLGTLRYAAPEQMATATLKVGPAADVRALGCVLWELLTRRRLFAEARDEAQLGAKILGEDVPRLRALDGGFDRDLEAILARATERNLADRTATAAELAEHLQLYLDGKPLPIRTPGGAELVRRWIRRNRLLTAFAMTCALLIVIVAVAASIAAVQFKQLADEKVQSLRREQKLRRVADQRRRAAQEAEAREEAAKNREIESRHRAESQEQLALKQAKLARRRLYGVQMNLVAQDWQRGEMYRVSRHLRSLMPDRLGEDLIGWEWKYWQRQTKREILTVFTKGVPPVELACSPDGKRIAACTSTTRSIGLWNPVTGEQLATLEGHQADVHALVFSPDGTRLASGATVADPAMSDAHGEIIVWDLATGQPSQKLSANARGTECLAFSPDGTRLAAGGADNTVQIWNLATSDVALQFQGHARTVTGVGFSGDGKRIVSCSLDQSLRISSAEDGSLLFKLDGHASEVNCLAVSPEGVRVASGGNDGTCRIWSLETGQPLRTLSVSAGAVSAVRFGPDMVRLATGHRDGSIRVWDLNSGAELHRYRGHYGAIMGLVYSPDGSRVISASVDKAVKVWDELSGQDALSLRDPAGTVHCLTFSPDGRRLATLSGAFGNADLVLWDLVLGQELKRWNGVSGSGVGLAFAPDGQHLAVVGEGSTSVQIRDATSGDVLTTIKEFDGLGVSLAFSPDGFQLAVAVSNKFEPGKVCVFQARTGEKIRELTGFPSAVNDVAYSRDGSRLLAAGHGAGAIKPEGPGRAILWDAATLQELRVWDTRQQILGSVAISPFGNYVALGGLWPQVWGTKTGTLRLDLREEGLGGARVAFSRDGSRLATGVGLIGNRAAVRLYEYQTGQEVLSLEIATDGVRCLQFSPDGRKIAACGGLPGQAGEVKIWQLRESKEQDEVERQALGWLNYLFARLLPADAMLEIIQSDDQHGEAVRKAAKELAQRWTVRPNANASIKACAQLTQVPSLHPSQYRIAFLQARELNRLAPDNPLARALLGASQFRLGEVEAALATMQRAEEAQKSSPEKAAPPVIAAFLAMAHHRLGHTQEAIDALDRLRELMHQPDNENVDGYRRFLAEAEAELAR